MKEVLSLDGDALNALSPMKNRSTLADELRAIAHAANQDARVMVREQLVSLARRGYRRVPLADIETPPGCGDTIRQWLEDEGLTIQKHWLSGDVLLLPAGV